MSESTQKQLSDLVGANSILAGELPEALQFTFLKNKGIEVLKALAGEVWSNYNDSDPGVTILEQIVFALTELGYVNTFDITDVLTQPDGSIDYQQQFYEAADILTTGPISANDYRKLVVDSMSDINNVYLQPLYAGEQATGLYQVWLYSKALLVEHKDIASARQACSTGVYQLLNKHRNVGEYFLTPQLLTAQTVTLAGEVLLSADADPQQVYLDIEQALADYVSPAPKRYGYQQAVAQGESASQIFDGPKLDNGWMLGDNPLGNKVSSIQQVELVTLISQVDGVTAVESFAFAQDNNPGFIDIGEDKIACLQLGERFNLVQHQAPLSKQAWQHTNLLSQIETHCKNQSVASSVDLVPKKPTGHYRDIESYYSVQNTFPNIYAVGPNSLESDASAYRLAQSRQLKGYLLLFDQVLANQFSQLANLANLFSFSFNTVPTSQQGFYQQSTQQNPEQPQAIPSQHFIRSYFYQPLYDVPDVQALLKGQQHYQFFYPDDPAQNAQREALVWRRFKDDPFNLYNHGLSEIVETQHEAQQRRDEMLSHLLARQGEPADLYDDIIDASQWYGSKLQTRIIVKSIWLQNMQQLSYRRDQALQFALAQVLPTPGRYRLSWQEYKKLITSKSSDFGKVISCVYQQGFSKKNELVRAIATSLLKQLMRHRQTQSTDKKIDKARVIAQSRTLADSINLIDGNKQLLENTQQRLMLDGQYDAQALDTEGQLSAQDFANFSTFEIKFDLLLGFSAHLRTLAAALVVLINDAEFAQWLTHPNSEHDKSTDVSFCADGILATAGPHALRISISEQPVMVLPNPSGGWHVTDLQGYIDQLAWLSTYRKGCVIVEHTLLQPQLLKSTSPTFNDPWYYLKASMVMPGYVNLVHQAKFIYFIRAIQQLHWSSHVSLELFTATFSQMSDLINTYCVWFNQQRRVDRHPVQVLPVAQLQLQTDLKGQLQALKEVVDDTI